jgi:hypothetical protein
MSNFNPTAALDYARQLSQPRQVGSREESLVAGEIAGNLRKLGFRVNFQPFRFSTALDVFLTAEIIVGQVLILTTMLLVGISPWLTLVQSGLLAAVLVLSNPINRAVQRGSVRCTNELGENFWSSISWRVGSQHESRNILASLQNPSPEVAKAHLILAAHYDSKSQRFPLVLRLALFVVLITGSFVFIILNLLGLVAEAFIPMAIIIGSMVIISGMPLLIMGNGNDSPGAIDDASGVGLILHLAEILAQQAAYLKKLDITLLVTSAEEMGVKGALACLKEYREIFHRQSKEAGLYSLNFDGIGVEGKLYLVGRKPKSAQSRDVNLFDLVRNSCKQMGISIGRFSLPGAMFDHVPFEQEGLDAISIISIGSSSWWIHTRHDSPDKLDSAGFEQAGKLALRVIEELSGITID